MIARQVHPAEALTGESPSWDAARGILWWIDIQGQRLLGHRPDGGAAVSIPLPSMPGLVCAASDGRLVLGLEDGLWLLDPETRRLELHKAVDPEDPRTRLNDGKPDAHGRLWFGTMDKTGGGAPIGKFMCLDTDGDLKVIRTGVVTPNAIVVSPDGRTLYFADTPTRKIERFALDPSTGTLGAPETLVEFPEGHLPDGACVDAEGALWVAIVGAGRLARFAPDGTELLSVALPVTRPTMAAFGGTDLQQLFITSQRRFLTAPELLAQPDAGGLLELPVPLIGLPPAGVRII